ncbi:hypothetical protein BDZ94DRAFT_593806 [Collybia nuda]|uniref:F-box domain-containing protein n=1 Tax=Collybia nuda TaxID=64659 RepID=A0A9P5Y7J4_9AGAR|nr:hypothetical protein BDZ94DRAFT_593806 [Collybia nuda]
MDRNSGSGILGFDRRRDQSWRGRGRNSKPVQTSTTNSVGYTWIKMTHQPRTKAWRVPSSQPKIQLEQLTNDIFYEILSHLPVEDIVRLRQVCKWLQEVTRQRAVWSSVYEKSNLLRPEGPTPTQTAQDLENLLVHFTKIQRKWSEHSEVQPVSRKSIKCALPYIYGVAMVSGRYLIVGAGNEISWYDLDQDSEGEWLDVPVAKYDVSTPGAGPIAMQFLSAQANPDGEGPDVAYVSFFVDHCMKVLKVKLLPPDTSVETVAEFGPLILMPSWDRLQNDYLLVRSGLSLVPEIEEDSFILRLFHIPTRREYGFVLDENVLSHASYWNCMITTTHLIMLFPQPHRHETDVVIFNLPTGSSIDSSSVPQLAVTHTAVYPCSIWGAECVHETTSSNDSGIFEVRVRILAICHEGYECHIPIFLEYLDIIIPSVGTVKFLKHSSALLRGVRPGTMEKVLTTSCSSITFALSYSQSAVNPIDGQIITMHVVMPGTSTDEGTIATKRLTLPGEKDALALVGFDGFRGRICFNAPYANIPRIDIWSLI